MVLGAAHGPNEMSGGECKVGFGRRRRDEIMGVLLVIFGAMAIVGGVLGKDFHAADVIALGEFRQKSSRWSGRLVFIIVGVGLIGIGIKMCLGSE